MNMRLALFTGILICHVMQGQSQSPFLLYKSTSSLKATYLSGQLDSLVNTTRGEFLILQKERQSDAYWQAYQDLLYAYFTIQKWDLVYLMADDLSISALSQYGKNSEEFAIVSLIKGVALNELGKVNEADSWFRAAHEIVKKNIPTKEAQLFILLHYASYLRQVGEYTASGRIFDQIEYSFHFLNGQFSQWRLDILCERISLEMEMGLIDNAQQSLEQIRHAQLSNINGERKIKLSLTTAEYYLSIEAYEKASLELENAAKSLTNFPNLSSQRLILSLLTTRLKNHLHQEVEIVEEEWNQSNPSIVIRLLIEKGKSKHLQGAYLGAIKVYNEAMVHVRNNYTPEHPTYQQLLTLKGISAWANGDINKAANNLNRAAQLNLIHYIKHFAFLSDHEKQAFYDANKSFENIYGTFVRQYYQSKPVLNEMLMNHLITFKGLLFNQTLALRQMVYEHKDLRVKFDQYLETRARIQLIRQVSRASANPVQVNMYDSLIAVSEELEKELSLRTFLVNKENIAKSLTSSWSELRLNLSPSQALVEVMHLQKFDPMSMQLIENQFDYLFLFFNRHSAKPQLLSLDGEQIKRQLAYYRNAVKHQILDTKSYDILWKPVEKAFGLRRYESIYLVPDGVYNLINLTSLFRPSDYDYIISQYAVDILGNSSDLKSTAFNRIDLNRDALLIGYPIFSAIDPLLLNEINKRPLDQLSRNNVITLLPGTKEEIEKIANILEGSDTPVIKMLGEEASESQLKQLTKSWKSPQLIHIATHGFAGVNSSSSSLDPLEDSGLLLAGAEYANDRVILDEMILSLSNEKINENGILLAKEAMDMHLMTTDMVILSACESGTGKVTSGEGVYGLHRGFQTAGAKSVLMTLWKVDDQATKDFMISFYEDWVLSHDVKRAYQYAQEQTREKYKNPYYWAAFILVGK